MYTIGQITISPKKGKDAILFTLGKADKNTKAKLNGRYLDAKNKNLPASKSTLGSYLADHKKHEVAFDIYGVFSSETAAKREFNRLVTTKDGFKHLNKSKKRI